MKCKLTIITPCHIGSGIKLRKDIHYVISDRQIGIIDPIKVFDIVSEEGIKEWCNIIENKHRFIEFIKGKKSDVELKDYCSKIIDISGEATTQISEFRTHISTVDVPYIPGSSLKGAIVSALIGEISRLGDNDTLQQDNEININAKNNNIVTKAFAKSIDGKLDIRTSALRYLRVGDAHFTNQTKTKAVRCFNINIRKTQPLEDVSKPGYIEALTEDNCTTFTLDIKSDLLNKAAEVEYLGYTYSAFDSVDNLLQAVNNHTLRMLEDEWQRWSSYNSELYPIKTEDNALAGYLKHIEGLISIAQECQESKSALLRVGHGNGWDSITGGWISGGWDISKHNTELWKKLLPLVRKEKRREQNVESVYKGYVFPKTRRTIDGYSPMGFVKIELCR